MEHHEKKFLHAFWETVLLERNVLPGEVVFLCDQAQNLFHHAAICIHGDLFISVYGGGGDIEFSSLEDMRRELGAPDVLVATPKT